MQYITTGNRIAVENFTIGDLYTITFTNGNYINSACIGIGANFVTFQRNLPELLFTLTMETAELVSSIELYAGGTGTTNYNELTNKPSINSVELVGNKSLAALGIQPEITEESPLSSELVSGLGSAAAAETSDFATAAQGALAASAVQPATMDAALALKQDALSSAQLAAVNSGITSTDVSQISINKNNISLVADQSTRYNLSRFAGAVAASDGVTIASGIEIDIPSGDYYVKYDTTANSGTVTIGIKDSGNSNVVVVEVGNTVKLKQFTVPNNSAVSFNVYVSKAGTYSNFQIIPKSLYDAGFTEYQPYALSNVELTAKEQTNENNILLKISEYTAPTTITLAIAETYEGGTVYNGYCGNDFPTGLAGLYVAITTHKSGNPQLPRQIQEFVFQNGERKSRYYNGTTWTSLA